MKKNTSILLPVFVLIFVLTAILLYGATAEAATNISSTNKWAWNDVSGWIDFNTTNTVNVTNSKIEGYAVFYNEQVGGFIALDCTTSPNGNICSTSNFSVTNDGNGNLSGWGWSDSYGWISFCGNASSGSTYSGGAWICPASPTYRVTFNTSNGDFSGWAWNDVIGWISFNCNNSGIGDTCATSSYKVSTAFNTSNITNGSLISSTFDTGHASGVKINSIMWLGSLGTGGSSAVKFQIATANCSNGATDAPTCTTSAGWGGSKTSGDGAFIGNDGTSTTYYVTTGAGTPYIVPTNQHVSKRYFRYKVYLEKDGTATTPTVQDVIINLNP